MKDIFKTWHYACISCTHKFDEMHWESEATPRCPACGSPGVEPYYRSNSYGRSAAVVGDECDVLIRHGICNEDGTPRRFRSKAEIKKAASDSGWVQLGDTPKLTSKQSEEVAQNKEAKKY